MRLRKDDRATDRSSWSLKLGIIRLFDCGEAAEFDYSATVSRLLTVTLSSADAIRLHSSSSSRRRRISCYSPLSLSLYHQVDNLACKLDCNVCNASILFACLMQKT